MPAKVARSFSAAFYDPLRLARRAPLLALNQVRVLVTTSASWRSDGMGIEIADDRGRSVL